MRKKRKKEKKEVRERPASQPGYVGVPPGCDPQVQAPWWPAYSQPSKRVANKTDGKKQGHGRVSPRQMAVADFTVGL